jgi:ubiquinone/menaquinone biosynthesis C-methylase UbiE
MVPWLYDFVCAPCEALGLSRWRSRLVGTAAGRVLEIGAGNGHNLPYYRSPTRLVLTDPDPAMLAGARRRARRLTFPVEIMVADAEALPFAPATFDAVVATLVFCTIPHLEAAFAEVRRVLTPGGRLLLLEHVRTPRAWVARMQDWATPLWKHVAHGCHLNRRPLEMARAGGFIPLTVRHGLDGWVMAAELRAG